MGGKRKKDDDKDYYYGHYFKDVELLLHDYFAIGNIDVEQTLYMEDEKTENGCGCKFKKSLYPIIQFDGFRSKLIPSRNKLFEECGGGERHIIFLSLVDFSIRLLYEDCSTEVCNFKESVGLQSLDLTSLIQSLPIAIFEKVISYCCKNIRISDYSSSYFVLKTSDDKSSISKLGYFKRISFFSSNSVRNFYAKFKFTEEQETYLLQFLCNIPSVKTVLEKFV